MDFHLEKQKQKKSLLPMKTAVDPLSNTIATELPSTHIFIALFDLNS